MHIDDWALGRFIGLVMAAQQRVTPNDIVRWLYTPVDSAGREARRRELGEWLVDQIEK